MENNIIPNANKIKIDPIPSVLRIYGFFFMILIFCIVLGLAKMIRIPMGYNGVIKETHQGLIVVKLGDLHKSEFLPELGDTIKLIHLITDEEIGKYCIYNVSIQDSTIIIQSSDSTATSLIKSEVKILSRNKSLFNMVFDRFY